MLALVNAVDDQVYAVEKTEVVAAELVMFYCDSGSSPCRCTKFPECLAQLHYYHP
jgi:hypothetical protein